MFRMRTQESYQLSALSSELSAREITAPVARAES
jgi:hypothetical protein